MPTAGAITTGFNTGTQNITISHEVVSGSDRCLVVRAVLYDTLSSAPDVTGVTYGGNAMTLVGRYAVTLGGVRDGELSIWRLLAPTVGTADVVVSTDQATLATVVAAQNYTGVDQTTPTRTVATSNTVGTSTSISVTSQSGDLVIDLLGVGQDPTVGAGQTEQFDVATGVEGVQGAGSVETASGTSTTMSWTAGTTTTFMHMGVALVSAPAAAIAPQAFHNLAHAWRKR